MASQSSAGGGAPRFEPETVVQEVSRAYELIKKLQALLRLGPKGDAPSELAWLHFKEAMQALNVALSIMKPGQAPAEPLEPLPVESGSPSRSLHGSQQRLSSPARKKANGSAKRKREDDGSWMTATAMPYDDGYQWRKYGEKKISASQFPRSYFRCTFKEEHGCPATKVVQQKDRIDPPLFSVIYQHEHSCRRTCSAAACRDVLPTPVPSPPGTSAAACSYDELPPKPQDCNEAQAAFTNVCCEAPTSPDQICGAAATVFSPVAVGIEEAILYSSGCGGPTLFKPHGLDVDQIMDHLLSFEVDDDVDDLLWSMC